MPYDTPANVTDLPVNEEMLTSKSDVKAKREYHIPSFYGSVIEGTIYGTVYECHRKITTHFDRDIKKSKSEQCRKTLEEDKLRYFVDTSALIFDYYSNPETTSEKTNTEGIRPENKEEEEPILKDKKHSKRDLVVDRYRQYVDPVSNACTLPIKNNPFDKCQACGCLNSLVVDDVSSSLLCTKCGLSCHRPLLKARPSYKTTRTRRPTQTQYKRENHFNDWLTQIQAKESISVPEHVYDQLRSHIKKSRTKRKLSATAVRSLMREIGLNKYYEHIPRIIHRLHGTIPPNIDQKTEERLRIMFKKIQGPFEKYSPNKRKNFLSYAFVLRKFVSLLQLDHLKKHFPLLKSRAKLYQQDKVWKKICKDLNWHYEQSI